MSSMRLLWPKAMISSIKFVVTKGRNELDEIVMAKWATDKLDELIVGKSYDELNEHVMAKGRDELNELVMAKSHDEHNELFVARSQDELNVLICDEFAKLVVVKVSENTMHLCSC
jgi:hypothetical protein